MPKDACTTTYDVLVIGARVLGCAAAVTFTRQNRNALLLERNLKEPDHIVGELLQPGGVVAWAWESVCRHRYYICEGI